MQKLLEKDPNEEDVLEMLGMAYFLSKQYGLARETFERLTKANPMHLNGWKPKSDLRRSAVVQDVDERGAIT